MHHSDNNLRDQAISQKYVIFGTDILNTCSSLILSGVEADSTETEVELELHKCSAYEIVKLSRQRVKMETNPAYGEVGQFHH